MVPSVGVGRTLRSYHGQPASGEQAVDLDFREVNLEKSGALFPNQALAALRSVRGFLSRSVYQPNQRDQPKPAMLCVHVCLEGRFPPANSRN
jgi:hypothetical protein